MPEDEDKNKNEDQKTNDQQNNNTNHNNKPIVLGCDSNGVNDEQCVDIVKKALESAGYTVEALGIAPGPFAEYSYSSNASGKVGVYLMAASLVSFLDAAQANFDLNILGIRGDVTSWGTEEGFKTKGVPKDHHGDCTLPECDQYAGKTYPELNEIYKGKCVAVPGETPEKLAQNIIAALGGQYNGIGGGTNTSSGGAQIKDKTFEHCIKRICAATDSVFLVENNAAVLFPYTDWMAFTLRHQINQIKAKDMDPDLFEIDYNTDGFYNKVTVVWGADEEQDKITLEKEKEDKKKVGNTTTIQKTMPTGGTQLSEQYDPLVNIYGELEKKVTTNFPNEETAHYVMNALLIQYIRDFNNSCRVRAIHNNKYIGGTFHAVENPNTKKSELFYLNSYTIFKEKGQPLVTDLEFKYGPEGAEELLDYQTYGGGGVQTNSTTADGSATEQQIWEGAKKPCHQWTCSELRVDESDATDPQVAEDYYNKMVKANKKFCLTCYGMSSWLYYQFNNKAGIPCRVIGNDEHHVVELYKNNAWYKPIEEYRQIEEGYRYNDFCKGNAPVVLDAPNPPSGSSSNANPSGNTANQNKGGNT